MIIRKKVAQRHRIKQRIRKKVLGTAQRPRLTVYRSLRHIYAQIVDDSSGKTIVSSSSNSKELRDRVKETKSKKEVSKLVGMEAAKQAIAKNIQTVVFDRNGYRYHGNVKALADGAREAGLKF